MQGPISSITKQAHPARVAEFVGNAAMDDAARTRRHKKEILRYVVVVAAFLAVMLLLSIALYYTRGHSVTVRHIGSLAPAAVLCPLYVPQRSA